MDEIVLTNPSNYLDRWLRPPLRFRDNYVSSISSADWSTEMWINSPSKSRPDQSFGLKTRRRGINSAILRSLMRWTGVPKKNSGRVLAFVGMSGVCSQCEFDGQRKNIRALAV